jgi:predicted glycosyltransferase
MKIIIDIGHPGHVHLFSPFARIMIKQKHKILFTCRQKEFEIELLEAAEFDYVSFGNHFKTKLGKLWGLLKFDIKMFFISLKFKPDLYLSHGSFYAAHISYILRKPHISMEDSGNMEQIRLYLPFTNVVLTPFELHENLGVKQIKIHSFHELAYLRPKYFVPDLNKLKVLNVGANEEYALLRFVSWNATHDIGQGGFTMKQKVELVNHLASKMKLFISAEGKVPASFNKYLINIQPEDMHHVLSYAQIVISEGATMASEAGVLGTPAIYVNSLERCYNEDQEKYRTVFNFRNGNDVLTKVDEILLLNLKNEKNHRSLLQEKIDLTTFLVWFISDWPNSFKIMKENPDYQHRFK